jgi:hypothetical protein
MNTAVQLRPASARGPGPRCGLLHGAPQSIVAGRLGPVALFGSGQVVAYVIHSRRRPRLYVFRTLDVDNPLAVLVPGVRPRVQLLLELGSAGRVRRARRLFVHLVQQTRDLADLPDVFYLRVGTLLAGRRPRHKTLLSLVPPPLSAESWTP